jgi:hypothetical protein
MLRVVKIYVESFKLDFVMLSAIMHSVVKMNVITLGIVAPVSSLLVENHFADRYFVNLL